ncbi:YfbU family protein [Cupriavidus alkaliphilus]|uniref:YfbU family protein n=1 Tax=Cupriavidus alkaliphilus TaxID=942866 RepID=UPI000DDBD52C|nr:YfbU family protein [Cupriavidus alkaliphilus]
MKLTNSEKLILLMLSDIYDRLELNEIDTKFLRSAIYSENTWALDWEMSGVVGSQQEETPKDVTEVLDCLEMWSHIEEAYANFNAEERAQVEIKAEPFGRHVRFPGFDGNNEAELLGIARLLVDDMGRFSRFKGRDMNSHAPLREAYGRMLKHYLPMRGKNFGVRALSPQQMVELLQAMRHPDYKVK